MEWNQTVRMTEQYKKIWKRKGVPASAFFELSPRCTLDCKMCYVHLRPDQMGNRKELSTEQWLRICEEAASAGLIFVTLTGGECMLHPGFWEIYEHLQDLGVVVNVNTNAYTLRDEDLAHFVRRPPASVRVTLYGCSDEGYARCTGHRAFTRVLENVKKLRDARVNVGLAVTLSPWNKDEFVETFRLGRSLGLRTKCIVDLSEPNEDTGRSLEEISLSSAERVEMLKGVWACIGQPLFDNPPILEIPPLQPDAPPARGMHCSAGLCSYVVYWDGAIGPCFDFKLKLPLLELGLQAAWEQINRAAKEQLQPVECFSCRLRSLCENCAFRRDDPNNPGHRDPNRCKVTIDRYNAGLATLLPGDKSRDLILDRDE